MAVYAISKVIELPEVLDENLKVFIVNHPHLDQDQVMQMALSLFLLQNTFTPQSRTDTDRAMARIYLDTLFGNDRDDFNDCDLVDSRGLLN